MLPLYFLAALVSAVDAGADEDALPRSAEHKALIKQVELMKVEVARPRSWNDRERGERLKVELASLQRVLDDVEELYGIKLGNCRAYYVRASGGAQGTALHPGYFSCLAQPPVDDALVRVVRRQAEVQRRLRDKNLPSATRDAMQKELRTIDGRLERERGGVPLHYEPDGDVDAGQTDVPQDDAPGRAPGR